MHRYQLDMVVHRQTVHLGPATPADELMPGVHRVASLLKRWMMVTHHGLVQPRQLDFYLDESVFRFNRRTSRSRGLLFYRLLGKLLRQSQSPTKRLWKKAEKVRKLGSWS